MFEGLARENGESENGTEMNRGVSGRKGDRQRPAALRPGYLAALAGVLVLVLAAFAAYEFDAAQRVIRRAMEEGAASLAEAVARAGENALRADAEIEALAAEHLLNSARLLRELDGRGGLSDTLLTRIATENDLFRIFVFDAAGNRVLSSAGSRGPGFRAAWGLRQELEPLLRGTVEVQIIGFRQPPRGQGQRYAAAVRRRCGGAILTSMDAERMLEFRRTAGVGRLVREIGENPGIAYVAVQDETGILLASRQVIGSGLTPVARDEFLEGILKRGERGTRLTQFDDRPILETVMPFPVDEEASGLLRIGLEVDALQAEEALVVRRLVLLTVLLVVLGAVGVGLVVVRQNYRLLDEAYARVQTYSSRILEQMAEAVVATDGEGQVQLFNQAAERLFGIEVEQVLGQPCSAVMGEGSLALERSLKEGRELRDENYQFCTVQGRMATLSISTSLLRDQTGHVETAVAVIQDLTEKVALEADLRRRDRLAAMGELASGVAHEVRNPLNAISVIVQRLGREFEPSADRKEYTGLIRTVRDEVRRVDRIVQQFLAFARPPALKKRPVELAGLLEKTARLIEPRVQERGLILERDFAATGWISADPEQVEQALLNLLNNAVDATEQGAIRLEARSPEEGWVEIAVEDTGPGIPEADLERIFDLYYTTKPEGTGVGLSMVQRIVAEHGGRVDVQSAVGAGTRFTMHLPRGDDDGERNDSGDR